MEVTFDNGVNENTSIFPSVTLWYIDNIRFNDHCAAAAVGRRVESGDGAVILKAVIATNHAKAHNMAFVIKDLEALGAVYGREARYDLDLPESAYVAVPDDDVTALEKVLVGLRVVEAADDGPDGGDGGGDFLNRGGAALVRTDGVSVITGYVVGDFRGARRPSLELLGLFIRSGGGGGCSGILDSLEYKI